MSGFGFAEFSSVGNNGTRNPLLYSNGSNQSRTTNGNFYSYTMPANTLTNDGDFIIVEGMVTGTTDSGRSGTISIIVGGTTAISYSYGDDLSPEDMLLRTTLIRTASNALRSGTTYVVNYQDLNSYNMRNNSAAITVDLTASVAITLTVSGIIGTAVGRYFMISNFLQTG